MRSLRSADPSAVLTNACGVRDGSARNQPTATPAATDSMLLCSEAAKVSTLTGAPESKTNARKTLALVARPPTRPAASIAQADPEPPGPSNGTIAVTVLSASMRNACCRPALLAPDPAICPAALMPQADDPAPPRPGSATAGRPGAARNAVDPSGATLSPTTLPAASIPKPNVIMPPASGSTNDTPVPGTYRKARNAMPLWW